MLQKASRSPRGVFGLLYLTIFSIASLAPALAAEGWERATWGMTPAQVTQAYPEAAGLPRGSNAQCPSSRAELPVIEIDRHNTGGRGYAVRFCFATDRTGAPQHLRSVRLGLLDTGQAEQLARELRERLGRPYRDLSQAGSTHHTLFWVASTGTLVEYDYDPGSYAHLSYISAQPWPSGGAFPSDREQAAALTAAGAKAAAPLQGEWRYIPPIPQGGGGPKFGWVSPELPNHFAGVALLCAEGRPPGQATAYIPVAEPTGTSRSRPAEVTVRISAGSQAITVRGIPEGGPVGYDVPVPLRRGHPLLAMLGGSDTATITIDAPSLPTRRYPLRNAAERLHRFIAACGLG